MMNVAFLIGKTGLLLFWGVVIVSLFSVFPKQIETILGWAGVTVLLIHSVEVAIFASRFDGRLDRPKPEKLKVLVFGLFYVLPFMRKVKS
jgi:uncharacterized protein YhhL (DUF1145 family)